MEFKNSHYVLPKCMNDLLKCGIGKENITVFDLHKNMTKDEISKFDVVYLCGGRSSYLLERINATGFRDTLIDYIKQNGMVLGVSAGSIIFANNLPDNLGMLDTTLSVHCEKSNAYGKLEQPLEKNLQLSNNAAMVIRNIPDDMLVIDSH